MVLLLLVFLVSQDPVTKIVTKTEYETVIEEKIIYQDRECKDKIVNNKEEVANISDIVQEDVKEYIIASTTDNRHRFTVSLFSYAEPFKVSSFKKVVLNGTVKNDEFESIFIMDINQVQINELNEVYFKIEDKQTNKQTKEVYIAQDTCLYNLVENFIYKVDLEISGNEVICSVSEDRELEEGNKNQILRSKPIENIKSTFLKMDF